MINVKELDVREYDQLQQFINEQKTNMTIQEVNLLNGYVGKWPQLVVTGTPVTEVQAMDFIIRTDRFFSSYGSTGNNKDFEKRLCELFGITHSLDLFKEDDFEKRNALYNQHDKRLKELDIIPLEFLNCSFLSSSFIGGPHGIVHPDGQIFYNDNIGSYPSVETVYAEFCVLAANFPYLELEATLYDEENGHTNKEPVISFSIENGKVSIVHPSVDIHKEKRETSCHHLSYKKDRSLLEQMERIFHNPVQIDGRTYENAISLEACENYLNMKFPE